jgi:hypothetical protein
MSYKGGVRHSGSAEVERKAFSAYMPDILSSELHFTVTGSVQILLPSGQHPYDDVN